MEWQNVNGVENWPNKEGEKVKIRDGYEIKHTYTCTHAQTHGHLRAHTHTHTTHPQLYLNLQ